MVASGNSGASSAPELLRSKEGGESKSANCGCLLASLLFSHLQHKDIRTDIRT